MRFESRGIVPAGHPSLAGHFPGRPVVPGVLLLQLVETAVAESLPGYRVAEWQRVKFLAVLEPGGETVTTLRGQSPRLDFQIHDSGSRLLCEGKLLLLEDSVT